MQQKVYLIGAFIAAQNVNNEIKVVKRILNFQLLAEEYKTDEIMVKRKIKRLPTIGRVTYKALSEFLSIYYS